jgi:Caspase domain
LLRDPHWLRQRLASSKDTLSVVLRGIVNKIAILLLTALAGLHSQPRRIVPLGAHGRRIALVVGNDDYRPLPKLTNAVNDALSMGRALRELGFEVVEIRNATREQMDVGTNDFIGRLRKGDVALFYYSGHATQINGENYIAPVDLEVVNEIQARNRSIGASEILSEMEAVGTDLQIVILDACRNNPFANRGRSIGGRGLAPMNAGKGTFIAYATAPGQTADDNAGGGNGLFTKHLLEVLKEPGQALDVVFNRTNGLVQEASRGAQVPWTASSGSSYSAPRQCWDGPSCLTKINMTATGWWCSIMDTGSAGSAPIPRLLVKLYSWTRSHGSWQASCLRISGLSVQPLRRSTRHMWSRTTRMV